MRDLPWEVSDLVKSLRGQNQIWRYDPADTKKIEALLSFEWKGDLIRGREHVARGKGGDCLEVSDAEARQLVQEGKAIVFEGGYCSRLIFETEPTLGFLPWDPPETWGAAARPVAKPLATKAQVKPRPGGRRITPEELFAQAGRSGQLTKFEGKACFYRNG
jgi:hypothetical protein